MGEPLLKKENTIGINYVRGFIRDWHYETIIEKILGVPENEIEGIDDRGNNRFLFKVTTADRYENISVHFAGREIPIGYGNIIQVDDISSYGTMVDITRVPFEIDNEVVKSMLRKFGDIYKCQTYYRKFGKYTKFSSSGKRVVWMNIKEHIPQSLTINQTKTTINVSYQNQPWSCNICGNADHRARRCTVDQSGFKNLVDIVLPLPNTSDEIQKSVDEVEKIITDTEVHIDPSQESKPLSCLLCDYTCKYDHILIDHMETHSKDKSFECTECNCNYKCLNENVLRNHLKSHDIYVCDKCNYRATSTRGLSNHMKTHKDKQFKCKKCDFTANTLNKLNVHMRTHTDDAITIEANESEKTPGSSNAVKRGLPVSPEIANTDKTSISNSNLSKKSKN